MPRIAIRELRIEKHNVAQIAIRELRTIYLLGRTPIPLLKPTVSQMQPRQTLQNCLLFAIPFSFKWTEEEFHGQIALFRFPFFE